MAIFSKESLEAVRQRVDLIDVLSSYMDLKRTGNIYKGLCPFHDEKTPSFVLRKGDTHYHCFGCGAHGDAVKFLMTHQKMTFTQSIELLAHRFQIPLEIVQKNEENRGPNKILLKNALEYASHFFQFFLLHTADGHTALNYLYQRGIDLAFIQHFQIGLSPKKSGILYKAMQHKGIGQDLLIEAGLLNSRPDGNCNDFFSNRLMFPIHQTNGDMIGFSGRKYQEETFGGKYINTPETVLFKKSHTLFGLNYSRKRIIKEQRAIIVEGQIDALRLIQEGLNCTVAGQGTAFGEGHVKELVKIGVQHIFLALDNDKAGQEAITKIGHLFQKEGIEVHVVIFPIGHDPDSFLCTYGIQKLLILLEESIDYLSFLVKHFSQNINLESPAAKNELINKITKLVHTWNHPVMIHETLRKLAHMLQVPAEYMGIGCEPAAPNVYVKKSSPIGIPTIDSDLIIECDLLRWMLFIWQEHRYLIELVKTNISKEHLHVPICKKFFNYYFEHVENQQPCDLTSLINRFEEEQGATLMSELLQKKINTERAETQLIDTIQKILDRNWMKKKEKIKIQLHNQECSEEEAIALIKQFDVLQRNSPRVISTNSNHKSTKHD